MKTPQFQILDDIHNLGFLHGLGSLKCITTLALIEHLSGLDDFHPTEGLDLLTEYNCGFEDGKAARQENLLQESEEDDVSEI